MNGLLRPRLRQATRPIYCWSRCRDWALWCDARLAGSRFRATTPHERHNQQGRSLPLRLLTAPVVPSRRSHVRVTGHPLHFGDVRAAVQEVGDERPAEVMGGELAHPRLLGSLGWRARFRASVRGRTRSRGEQTPRAPETPRRPSRGGSPPHRSSPGRCRPSPGAAPAAHRPRR
jgi:hypothetical protein